MGMYTGLILEATIKPEFATDFRRMHAVNSRWQKLAYAQAPWFDNPWGQIAQRHPHLPGLRRWAQTSRASFIPFGALAYMPDDWEKRHQYQPETQQWSVCCSLKNYQGEIRQFVTEVLPLVASKVTRCLSLYEEYDPEDGWEAACQHYQVVPVPYLTRPRLWLDIKE